MSDGGTTDVVRGMPPNSRQTSAQDRLGGAPKGTPSGKPAPAPTGTGNPVLLVGNLKGLSPATLKVSMVRGGAERAVSTSNVDFRRVNGFNDAAKRAIASLGFGEALTAEVKVVNSSDELLKAIRANGPRQT